MKQRSKHRTIPPGMLHSVYQAQRCFSSAGLSVDMARAGAAKRSEGGSGSASGRDQQPNQHKPQQPAQLARRAWNRSATVANLFRQAKNNYYKQQRTSFNDHVALLNLPGDVLLKIVCCLKHEEALVLGKACRQLRNTVKKASKHHFNYLTPSLPGAKNARKKHQLGKQGRQEAGAHAALPAARSSRLAPCRTSASRALRFSTPSGTPVST